MVLEPGELGNTDSTSMQGKLTWEVLTDKLYRIKSLSEQKLFP